MRDELIKDVYFGAYQHIGFSFMEKIIDERIISVNMGALHQMSLGLVPKTWRIDASAIFVLKWCIAYTV